MWCWRCLCSSSGRRACLTGGKRRTSSVASLRAAGGGGERRTGFSFFRLCLKKKWGLGFISVSAGQRVVGREIKYLLQLILK